MTSDPHITIVMPCFQQIDFLEEAVRSVLEQKVPGVELLVMDPGSKDGSRNLLISLRREYGDRLVLNFEPDQGQSDAINRGFEKARGQIFGWLNSDDRLRPGTLQKVSGWLDSPEPRWLYGRAGMIDAEGNPCANSIVCYKNYRGKRFSLLKLLTENFIPQMAVFWNRAMWERAGGLDKELHLDMDYDLWLRFARVSNPRVINEVLADFRIHGESKGSSQTGAQLKAAFATAVKHAEGLGWRGKAALVAHLLLGMRTRFLYWWMKPRRSRDI